MKNKIYIPAVIIIIVTTLVILNSCHKVKDNNPAPGTLGLHIHSYIDTNEINSQTIGQFFADKNGRRMSLTSAQYYVTGIGIQKTDGSWVDVPGIVLKRIEQEEYTVGGVPSGNYTGIRFYIGLDDAANTSPAQHTSAADSALSSAENFMYFGAGQGYKFLEIAGSVNIGGTIDTISYQTGGSANRKLISLPPLNFTVLPNQLHYVHISCDYAKLLRNIPLDNAHATNRIGNSYGTNPGTATMIADSIPNMLYFEPGAN